jgi:hypothetical protein
MKAPVCSHLILQYVVDIENERFIYLFIYLFFLHRHIKHLAPNRFDTERIIAPTRNKEQSRSLPRIPLPVCCIILDFLN